MVSCDVVKLPRYLIDVPSSIDSAKGLCHKLGMNSGCGAPHTFNLTSDHRCHKAVCLGLQAPEGSPVRRSERDQI